MKRPSTEMYMKKRVLYFLPNNATFINKDIELLSQTYEVKHFNLQQNHKKALFFRLIMQLFFLVKNLWGTSAMVCHFAGYSSLLPVMAGKVFNKPCLIIVAGTDAARFPKYRYGNFTKRLYGICTSISLRLASHILPVHESLVFQKYSFDPAGAPAQGYTVFVPETISKAFTPVYYGYDADDIKPVPGIARKKNSFITVGNLSQPSVFYRKGYDLIIELAKRRPELSFSLVGWDGQSKIDVPTNVSLLTYMDQATLKETLSAHEFYFQLSYMEGFPNALCEAMLCGCIPIGSNVSGIPHIIGDTGFILNQRDVGELDKLVLSALSHDNLALLSKNARSRIDKLFPTELRRNELVHLIEKYTT